MGQPVTLELKEAPVEQCLVETAESFGGEAYKWVSPGRRGVNDRLVVLPGNRIWFVECKRPGEEPRPLQQKVHRRLKKLGAIVFTVDSKEQVRALPWNA